MIVFALLARFLTRILSDCHEVTKVKIGQTAAADLGAGKRCLLGLWWFAANDSDNRSRGYLGESELLSVASWYVPCRWGTFQSIHRMAIFLCKSRYTWIRDWARSTPETPCTTAEPTNPRPLSKIKYDRHDTETLYLLHIMHKIRLHKQIFSKGCQRSRSRHTLGCLLGISGVVIGGVRLEILHRATLVRLWSCKDASNEQSCARVTSDACAVFSHVWSEQHGGTIPKRVANCKIIVFFFTARGLSVSRLMLLIRCSLANKTNSPRMHWWLKLVRVSFPTHVVQNFVHWKSFIQKVVNKIASNPTAGLGNLVTYLVCGDHRDTDATTKKTRLVKIFVE